MPDPTKVSLTVGLEPYQTLRVEFWDGTYLLLHAFNEVDFDDPDPNLKQQYVTGYIFVPFDAAQQKLYGDVNSDPYSEASDTINFAVFKVNEEEE